MIGLTGVRGILRAAASGPQCTPGTGSPVLRCIRAALFGSEAMSMLMIAAVVVRFDPWGYGVSVY